MEIQVSELIVRYMQQLGIDTIFGVPGAHILPVYDSLYDSPIDSVLVKHEQGAAFMAGGYARASGKISACIATAGPGATNLVTGIANAYADKLPILIITGETSTHIFGKGGLQESSGEGGSIDQNMLFQGITRYHKIIERSDYLPNVLNQVARILLSDNTGPVLLSFPYNVQLETLDDGLLDSIVSSKNNPSCHNNALAINKLTELIDEAHHPVIIAGDGCIRSGAQQVISQLSQSMNIPVASTLKAKGVISEQSPLSLGSLGVTSSNRALYHILEKSDLILIMGASFNERTSYLWNDKLLGRKIVQIDNDYQQLEKVFKADLAIHGDIRKTIDALVYQLMEKNIAPSTIVTDRAVAKEDTVFQQGFDLVQQLFVRLEKDFPTDIQVFDDNIILAQNFYHVSIANRYYPNSGISSLGHAIPAAIGARFAKQKITFAIIGDGGFQMCCMELMTAVNYQQPLTVILLNNASMGLIRKNQSQQYEKRFIDCDFVNPDYAELAKSFGIQHYLIEKDEDLDSVFSRCDFDNEINLLELMIDKNAFPNYKSGR